MLAPDPPPSARSSLGGAKKAVSFNRAVNVKRLERASDSGVALSASVKAHMQRSADSAPQVCVSRDVVLS